MELLEYLQRKLTPLEYEFAKELYSQETKIFMETLERFRKYYNEELKVMRDNFSIKGFENEDF